MRDEPVVLVVDDEESLTEELSDGLSAHGVDVLTAGNSRDARALVRQHPSLLVVVTDIRMAGGDGISLTRDLKTDPGLPPLEVIVMTAHGTPEDLHAASMAGASQIILKPFRLSEMREAVASALARARRARDARP